MPSEQDIQDAERARLEAIVAEHGSEGERLELLLSRVTRHHTFEGVSGLPPDPGKLQTLARRCARRAEFGFTTVECAGEPVTKWGCSCLIEALDSDARSRAAMLRAAARRHWSPPRRGPELPAPESEEQEAEAALPRPKPQAPLRREPEPEPPFRIVRRSRLWFDGDTDIRNRRF